MHEWARLVEPDWMSLWAVLHDASFLSICQDSGNRELTLEMELGFPGSTGEETQNLTLIFKGLRRILIYLRINPETEPEASDLSLETPEGWQRWYALGHLCTIGIEQFSEMIGDQIGVLEAFWSDKPEVDMGFGGFGPTDHENWYWLRIGSELLEVRLNGVTSSIEEVVGVGERAWDAWSAQK
jgi:hypothetical protein